MPDAVQDNTRVLVTFLGPGAIDLRKRGITPEQAAELRVRLAAFAEDWDSPEMAVYDDYTLPRLGCKRGDVILVLFPHSDLRTARPRPALVVQADELQSGLRQVIVVMISSRIARANHPARVMVQRRRRRKLSGLLADSVIMTNNLATIADWARPSSYGLTLAIDFSSRGFSSGLNARHRAKSSSAAAASPLRRRASPRLA